MIEIILKDFDLMNFYKVKLGMSLPSFRLQDQKVIKSPSAPCVLLIDEHEDMLNLLGSLLAKSYNLIFKRSTIDALIWMDDGHTPSLIITEFNFPYLKGLHFIKSLKSSGLYSGIPVIILSEGQNIQEEMMLNNISVEAIVKKPFDPVNLIKVIKSILYEPTLASDKL